MAGKKHLFTVTRGLLGVATLVALFLIAILALGLGALTLAALGLVPSYIPSNVMPDVPQSQILAAGSIAVAIALVCIALIAWMFLLTARIVDTASHGDPFVVENADRLNRIAFLLLAIQAMGLFFDLLMKLFPSKLSKDLSVYFDVSATGILAVLLIFVLARIFRHGSEMRADLEGTV